MCIRFAIEIMKLKQSFVRKLNHRGLIPVHLAIENGQGTIAMHLFKVDKHVGVSGKNDETLFHYLCKVENQYSILETAENNRPDIICVLLRLLKKNDYCEEVMND
ncbi:hypothetical protein GQ457_07G003140 [Hibiscus cannabinus]